MPHVEGNQEGGIPSYSGKGQPFCSIQTFNWWDKDHPHWGRQSTFLTVLISILISSKENIQNNVWPNSCVFHILVKLTQKMCHHRHVLRFPTRFKWNPASSQSPTWSHMSWPFLLSSLVSGQILTCLFYSNHHAIGLLLKHAHLFAAMLFLCLLISQAEITALPASSHFSWDSWMFPTFLVSV